MNRDHDRVALTERECPALAKIERGLAHGDAHLAMRLRGGSRRTLHSPWAAGVLLALGAVLMVAALERSLLLALAGAVLFAVGLAVGTARLRDAVAGRHRREKPPSST